MLSLVIPVFNEVLGVEDIVRRSRAALGPGDEIVVVDDGSTDGTSEILRNLALPGVRIVRHPANRGNGAAIVTGIRESRGEWIATIDADRTYDPADIPRLYARVLREHGDMIVGVRETLRHGKFSHRTAREILRQWAIFFARHDIVDINSGLRIVRRTIAERFIASYPRGFSLHIVLTVLAARSESIILYESIFYGQRTGCSKLSPGWRGPWHFVKFMVLILWVALHPPKKHQVS